MHLSFEIHHDDLGAFIDHWSSKYYYKKEHLYDDNIGKPFTKDSLHELFLWKNGSELSGKKKGSMKQNYPINFSGNAEKRYLDHKMGGSAIWNIFYLHCLSPENWPIFDQHTYRAMIYMKTGEIKEIPGSDKQKYEIYQDEYIPFLKQLGDFDHRTLDKALFAFGQFLKKASKYL